MFSSSSRTKGIWKNPVQQEESVIYNQNSYPWVSWLDAGDSFLWAMLELEQVSTTWGTCLGDKTAYTKGGGYRLIEGRYHPRYTDPTDIKPLEGKERDRFIDWATEVNSEDGGKELIDVEGEAYNAFYKSGNAFVLLRKFEVDGRPQASVHNLQLPEVRLSQDRRGIYHSELFREYGFVPGWSSRTTDNWAAKFYSFDWMPDEETGGECRIIWIKNSVSTHKYYGIPECVAGFLEGRTEYQATRYNLTEFETGFHPNAVITMTGENLSENHIKETRQMIKNQTGHGKNGRVLFMPQQGDDLKNTLMDLSREYNGSWLDLKQVTREMVFQAHRWHPVLSGRETPGKLGNSNRAFAEVWRLVMGTVIQPTRDIFAQKFRRPVMDAAGFENVSALIKEDNHIMEMVAMTDPRGIPLTANERRARAGLMPLEGEELEEVKNQRQQTRRRWRR